VNIKTLNYVNDRTEDGRVYAAMEGTESVIDDADVAMVALMKSLAARGLVEIAKDKAKEAAAAKAAAAADKADAKDKAADKA
jgi:hypothetical protein